MNKKSLKRLKELMAKSAADLTAAEQTELTSLNAKALDSKVDVKSIDSAIDAANDDEEGLTEEDITDIVTKAVKAATGNNNSDIAELVTKSLAEKQVSAEMITKVVNDALAQHIKSAPKMEFPTHQGVAIEMPIVHRGGNLSVSQKQLLNIIMMKSWESCGASRPNNIDDGIPATIVASAKRASDNLLAQMRVKGVKAVTAGTIGDYSAGAFGGTLGALATVDLSTDLQMRLYLNSEIATLFQSREINMPTDPFKLPIKTTRVPFAIGGEPVSRTDYDGYVSGNYPGTAQITLDAKKLIGTAAYTYETDEDSIIAVLQMIQNDLGEAAAANYESAIINGDNDGTHQDTGGSYSASSVESAYAGLRKHALATGAVSWASGGLTLDNFIALRSTMAKYGVNPSDLVIIVDPIAYLKMQAEDSAFRYDVRGTTDISSNTGRLPYFNGIRVVVSEQMHPLVTTGR